jgi:photosystem II stability/assembly factor-like uncharacterized protein
MRRILFFLYVLVLIGSSCRKSNYSPYIPPPLKDSLLGWKVIGNFKNKHLWDIWFISAQKGFLLGDQLYQTSDGGENWQITPNTSAIKNFDHLFFVDAKNGFAYDSSHLATTVDGGLTWKVKPLPTDSAVTMFFVDAATGFYSDRTGGSLKKTTDSGNTWKSIAKNSTSADIYYPFFFDADTGYIATGQGIFASTTNGGSAWTSTLQPLIYNGYGLEYNSYNQLLFLDREKGFYANPDGVIETTDGGQTWNYSLNGTYDIFCFENIIRFPDPNTGYYKGYTVIYKTPDGGQSWNMNCRLGEDYFLGISFIDAHTGWACTYNGRVLKLQE